MTRRRIGQRITWQRQFLNMYVGRLIEILKIYKGKKVPDELESTMPAPKQMPIVGTLTLKVQDLDREREGKLEGFNQGCWVE